MAYDFSVTSFMIGSAHGIALSKFTKFQARLKNLHRLGWPLDFQSTKGKASQYSDGDLVDLALAVEMLQLGLTPERMVHVLRTNRWPTLMAYKMAAAQLSENPLDFMQMLPARLAEEQFAKNPDSMFIYFDPTALHELSMSALEGLQAGFDGNGEGEDDAAASFFYGGNGIVKDMILGWNSPRARISLVNISAMLHSLALNKHKEGTEKDIAYRRHFFESVAKWADEALLALEGREAAEEAYVLGFIDRYPSALSEDEVFQMTGVETDRAEKYLLQWIDEVANGKHS